MPTEQLAYDSEPTDGIAQPQQPSLEVVPPLTADLEQTAESKIEQEAEDIGEAALEAVPVEIDTDPAKLISLQEQAVERLQTPEESEELKLPPVLYHTSPLGRHHSVEEHGIIPRDDPRNPGGVSGVAQMGNNYAFKGRVYLSVKPYWYKGNQVVYAVDTSMLDPGLLQVDEDNYPTGPGNHTHRPELDTPENINLALRGLPRTTREGVSGLKRTVAYGGIIPPEALIPVEAYEEAEGSTGRRRIETPKMRFESEKLRHILDEMQSRKAEEERKRQQEWQARSRDIKTVDI